MIGWKNRRRNGMNRASRVSSETFKPYYTTAMQITFYPKSNNPNRQKSSVILSFSDRAFPRQLHQCLQRKTAQSTTSRATKTRVANEDL